MDRREHREAADLVPIFNVSPIACASVFARGHEHSGRVEAREQRIRVLEHARRLELAAHAVRNTPSGHRSKVAGNCGQHCAC
jgi:hypothetical protein